MSRPAQSVGILLIYDFGSGEQEQRLQPLADLLFGGFSHDKQVPVPAGAPDDGIWDRQNGLQRLALHKRTLSLVPPPKVDSISSWAPIRSARSWIPSRPK